MPGRSVPISVLNPEGHASRQLGKNIDWLEFVFIDKSLSRPVNVFGVFRCETEVIGFAAFEGLFPDQSELVSSSALLWSTETGRARGHPWNCHRSDPRGSCARVLRLYCRRPAPVASEVHILAAVPIAAGQLLQRPLGGLGPGHHVIVGGFFSKHFAVGLSGRYADVLLVNVLASEFFTAVLVGGHPGHDAFGGQRLVGEAWQTQIAARSRAPAKRSIAIAVPISLPNLELPWSGYADSRLEVHSLENRGCRWSYVLQCQRRGIPVAA